VLPNPKLLTASPEVAQLAGWDEGFLSSDAFLRFFSGDMSAMRTVTSTTSDDGHQNLDFEQFQSWATPYALSIYGEEMYGNCPYQNGNGYGDGRAISIAEIYNPRTCTRLEFQLKGSGTTPFSRSADGRAVLRSSVREFLASEAMFHLGVETTRALSLIVSETGKIERPWFSPKKQLSLTDSRLKDYPLEFRKEVLKHANGQPDVLLQERMAICCRVAPSFLRVGHIELYARRYRQAMMNSAGALEENQRRVELKMIVSHMLTREYSHLLHDDHSTPSTHETSSIPSSSTVPTIVAVDALDPVQFQTLCLLMLQECSQRLCALTAHWVRVGYCQGNFNSDNCLVGGRTMDYGPFGFIEKYEKNWNMWTGGGEKYSFRHQHLAGAKNYFSLASSVALLFDLEGQEEVMTRLIPSHEINSELMIQEIYRQKLGFHGWDTHQRHLFQRLDDYLEVTEGDYTLFWRQLSTLPERVASVFTSSPSSSSSADDLLSHLVTNTFLLQPFQEVFYLTLSKEQEESWCVLLREWIQLLCQECQQTGGLVTTELIGRSLEMKKVSPKYIPREWMLIEAYSAAERWEVEPLKRLQKLFEHPYDEQPEYESQYYRKVEASQLYKGGVTCMTCSS
jgi:uncharacterized protein YdiU (UPF0061 family)